MKKIIESKFFMPLVAFVAGGALALIFYPTKKTEEEYKEKIKRIKSEFNEKIVKLTEDKEDITSRLKRYQEETSRKIESLRTENYRLRKSMKKRKLKIVKPDGTMIEKEYEEAQSEEINQVVESVRSEFNKKVASIEQKWKKVHIKRIKSIREYYQAKLKEELAKHNKKSTTVNEKKLRMEAGATTNKNIYVHSTYTLWGPIFIGSGSTVDITNKKFKDVRLGIGLEL